MKRYFSTSCVKTKNSDGNSQDLVIVIGNLDEKPKSTVTKEINFCLPVLKN